LFNWNCRSGTAVLELLPFQFSFVLKNVFAVNASRASVCFKTEAFEFFFLLQITPFYKWLTNQNHFHNVNKVE